MTTETAVLIVGAGPIGLATAIDLGRRGIDCIVVEQGDGGIDHPKATALNARTMEFLRRWGLADRVRLAGIPEDYPHTVLYVTSLTGYLIARIERPDHGMGAASTTSPERPQRCNQLWLDPILAERAEGLPSVDLRYRCELKSFEERSDAIVATTENLDTGQRSVITSRYLVDCSGGRSRIRETLGIAMLGEQTLDYNVSIFLRIPRLWEYHDKGKAALHSFVDPNGVKSNLIALDGRELWRFGLRGKEFFDDSRALDVDAHVRRVLGPSVPYELLSVQRWVTHDLVAERFRAGRVFLAGDAAHVNAPSGGFGLNTGLGDVVDLGWKLAAVLEGWGPESLLDSYDAERRPVAERNVAQATENYRSNRYSVPPREILEDSVVGFEARAAWGERIVQRETRTYVTDGIALGYRYDDSPLCVDDGTPLPPSTISEYNPTTKPGGRAPHVWLTGGGSILDLFGDAFVLVGSGTRPSDAEPLERAFRVRGIPLVSVAFDEPLIAAAYERRFVLVRPDGHVAWRSDELPTDPAHLAERVTGTHIR